MLCSVSKTHVYNMCCDSQSPLQENSRAYECSGDLESAGKLHPWDLDSNDGRFATRKGSLL